MPTVATGDVHYLRHSDARAHEALLCIQSGDSLKNPDHWKFETDHFYFKTPEEMALDFPGHDDAMRRTLEIAERCNVELAARQHPAARLPDARRPGGLRLPPRALRKRPAKALRKVDARAERAAAVRAEDDQGDGLHRLLPDRLGLHPLRHASTAICVGPGRGSAAGSLVAYCLEITDIDPIRYDLLFERFLNPDRKSMPDMDIDFAVAGRERVINYVTEKYGRDRVAQIITFSTMAARAAVRDAGRVLEVPYGVVDKIAKLIPEGPGQTLAECLKPNGELRKAIDSDPVAKEIIELAQPLEGLTRADSIHAAGVVIGAEPLIDDRAAAAEGRRPGSRHPVPDEGHRGARPAEDGLPRPAQPRRDRQGVPSSLGDLDISTHPDGRQEDLRDARQGRRGRRLPVRVVGHARGAPPGASRPSSRT